jgi:hypothetical protein
MFIFNDELLSMTVSERSVYWLKMKYLLCTIIMMIFQVDPWQLLVRN